MDKAEEMMQFCPSFVKDTSDSEEHTLPSGKVLPALSPRCSKSETRCFSGETSHCSEEGWMVEWGPYSFPCVSESLDYLRYYHRVNGAMKKGAEVFQSESPREPQASPGNVDKDKDKDTEEQDQPSPSLHREKGLELETCDGRDCPDQDPASDSPRDLGCWAWLQRAFQLKKK